METIKNEQIYAFDSLYTTNHIQMLKILLPCLNPPLQKNLALYIKFLELRYTISFLNAQPYAISGCGFDKKNGEQEIPVGDLLPYLTPQEAENLKQLQKSMDIMKQFSTMQKNMEALKGILPEGTDLETLFQGMMSKTQEPRHASSSGDVLKNMMSDSQKDLYEEFNKRFENL